jgi:hypothetical protein
VMDRLSAAMKEKANSFVIAYRRSQINTAAIFG